MILCVTGSVAVATICAQYLLACVSKMTYRELCKSQKNIFAFTLPIIFFCCTRKHEDHGMTIFFSKFFYFYVESHCDS